jgi:Zn-dependent protease with chaperone function
MRLARISALVGLAAVLAACAAPASTPPAGRQTGTQKAPSGRPVDAAQAERLQRVMVPLIRAMNKPRPLNQVKVGIIDDPRINAASAGNGEFFVTRGLLEKANDEQLLGVLAHEVAHDDLNHVTKAQALGAGLNIGMIILDQIIPGSGAVTPIAGTLVARKYGRSEEYAADKHGADILRRAGLPPEIMVRTLTWLVETGGGGQGGFFSTHPATDDRIEALRRVTQR